MRVIAGSARGIRLAMVPGSHVRPTADRVKESLFNVIGPYFEGGNALDLFAGTGALGIEALSRGVESAVFIDLSSVSTKTIQKNVKCAKVEEKAEIYTCDARVGLKKLKEREMCFELIFMDPPYNDTLILTLLELVSQHGLLHAEGVVVAEHAKEFSMPEEVGTLVLRRTLTYGNTWMSLYHLHKE